MKKDKVFYKKISKRAYTTQTEGIEFEVKINGKVATGFWSPYFRYVSQGVDVNSLRVSRYEHIDIFSKGGGHKMYELTASLEKLERQPKNLSFTGPYLSVDGLKEAFVNRVEKAISDFQNGIETKATLSEEFIKYFLIEKKQS